MATACYKNRIRVESSFAIGPVSSSRYKEPVLAHFMKFYHETNSNSPLIPRQNFPGSFHEILPSINSSCESEILA